MTAEEKSVLSLFMIGVLIVVGKVLAGGEPITPRLFIGRMCSVVLSRWLPVLFWCSFLTCHCLRCAASAPCWVSPVIR